MVSRRFSLVSFVSLILATAAIIILVYLVSPLRDPSFQPSGANAGSLVWWVKGMGMNEAAWTWVAFIFAGMLAINSMLVFWTQRIMREIAPLMAYGFVTWFLLFFAFIYHLLNQWLID